MNENYIVRIIKTELSNFKNVNFGEVKYVNFSNVEYRGILKDSDINGIYGQNGSGKTAIIESLDIMQHIMSGVPISYDEYAGMFNDGKDVKISNVFFVEYGEKKYKARYEIILRKIIEEKRIQIYSEKVTYWQKGSSWKKERSFEFSNPFYDTESILENTKADVSSNDESAACKIKFINSIQNLAVLCAQRNISLFFNQVINKSLQTDEMNEEETAFSDVMLSLYDFAKMRFQVVKVNQLAANYSNNFIPVNVHSESENEVMQGCIPLFVKGRGEFPEAIFQRLENIVQAINVALKAIIPNLVIELVKTNEEVNKEGIKVVQVEVYSNRDGKRFLTKYESEGIKRIISLLNYLISLYNNPSICLVVDELDAGIFEYLLGEIIGVLSEEAKGQLIFTSHNLRVLEKLDKKNIVCSTINPNNRFISMKGIEKNHNRRDFYIRTIVLGGQDEKLYDDTDLQDMGYAFKKAGKVDEDSVNLKFSPEFLELLNKNNSDEL